MTKPVYSGRLQQRPKKKDYEVKYYKIYKKVPGIKGRDHVTRPIRQGNNPNFEVLFFLCLSFLPLSI